VWSLEHAAEWQKRVSDVLTRTTFQGFVSAFLRWPNTENSMVRCTASRDAYEFSFVVCDGPPGATKGAAMDCYPWLATDSHGVQPFC